MAAASRDDSSTARAFVDSNVLLCAYDRSEVVKRPIARATLDRLREVAARVPLIGEVRGIGLAIGVEIVHPGTTEPDAAMTKEIVEGMRQNGVLIGTTGRHSTTLKIRPPLVFRREHADLLVQTLEGVMDGISARVEIIASFDRSIDRVGTVRREEPA